jgi:hypothetical protein
MAHLSDFQHFDLAWDVLHQDQLPADVLQHLDLYATPRIPPTSTQVLRCPLRMGKNPRVWAAPQIVAAFAPQRMDRCLCEFRHTPNVIKGSPGQTPKSIRDWLNRREPSGIARATIAVRVVDANRDDAAGIGKPVVVERDGDDCRVFL